MLRTADPEATLKRLLAERDPFYALADVTIHSRETPHEKIVEEIIAALGGRLGVIHGEAPANGIVPNGALP